MLFRNCERFGGKASCPLGIDQHDRQGGTETGGQGVRIGVIDGPGKFQPFVAKPARRVGLAQLPLRPTAENAGADAGMGRRNALEVCGLAIFAQLERTASCLNSSVCLIISSVSLIEC